MSVQENWKYYCERFEKKSVTGSRARNIESESRNGSALLRLLFKYGNNINMAFMEVNEKIDGSMNNLPRDLERPRIMKQALLIFLSFFLI